MNTTNKYVELRVRFVVRSDTTKTPQFTEALAALGNYAEFTWDVDYWTVDDEDIAQWKEELGWDEDAEEEVSNG